MLICTIGSVLVLRTNLFFCLNGTNNNNSTNNENNPAINNNVSTSNRLFPFKNLSNEVYKKKIIPIALIFCFNILLGNLSLRFIPVSFMQTIKSSVPGFTVLIQWVLGERFSKQTYYALIFVVGGVGLASLTEMNFELFGFLCALVASVTTALQSIISSKLLTSKDEKLDSMNLVYYMSPLSFLFLSPIAFAKGEFEEIPRQWEFYGTQDSFIILILSGLIAFGLNVSTFFVIANTSSLTATVAGNFKVILSIVISVIIFKNEITPVNALGCALALYGVYWYNMIRLEENNKQQQLQQQASKDLEAGIRK